MIARVRSSPETIIISFLFLVEAMPLLALETISSSFVSLLLSMSVLDSCACCFLGCWSSSQEQRPSPARCRNLEPSRERRLYYSSWTNVEAKSRATTLQQSGPVAPKCTCLLAHSTLGIEIFLKTQERVWPCSAGATGTRSSHFVTILLVRPYTYTYTRLDPLLLESFRFILYSFRISLLEDTSGRSLYDESEMYTK
jgi:hypothetical protein